MGSNYNYTDYINNQQSETAILQNLQFTNLQTKQSGMLGIIRKA